MIRDASTSGILDLHFVQDLLATLDHKVFLLVWSTGWMDLGRWRAKKVVAVEMRTVARLNSFSLTFKFHGYGWQGVNSGHSFRV